MKLSKIAAVLAALVLATVAFTGCVTTTGYQEQVVGQSLNMGSLPVKDFEVIGPVTVQTTEVKTFSIFHRTHIGSNMVNTALVEEAIKLGGHDVINVKVSKRQDSNIVFGGIFYSKRIYTYTATGLAIRYTETLSARDGGQQVDTNAYIRNYNPEKKWYEK